MKIQWKLSITDPSGTSETVFYMEVSLIQWLINTVMYYSGMRKGVPDREDVNYSEGP